jgi:hypothetical protein
LTTVEDVSQITERESERERAREREREREIERESRELHHRKRQGALGRNPVEG